MPTYPRVLGQECFDWLFKNVLIKNLKIKSIDHSAMKNDLQDLVKSCFEEDNLDTLVVSYESGLKGIMDKHAPVQTKNVTVRPLLSWYDPSLKVLKRSLRKAEQKWHRKQSQEDLRMFKTLRSNFNNKVKDLKSSYVRSKIEECAHNTKQFFKVVNQITNNTKINPLPPGNRSELAENFSIYFGTKIERIRSELDKFGQYEPIVVSVDKFEKFPEISEDQIRKLIIDANTTDCAVDPFPTKLVKEYIDVLLPLITKMVNLSLANGTFPSNWKEAILIPLLKKLSLELIKKNYRPVSNLQFLSKVTEKAALSGFIPHLKEHNLLPSYQSAYREHYSTETALVKVQNDLLIAADNHKVSLFASIDLSAAFDTVDHSILMKVLESNFGVTGTALKWFNSYLESRGQRVKIDNVLSDKSELRFGVPQGSCAGPILYSVYASTLSNVIDNNISVMGYTDDHALYSTSSTDKESVALTLANIELCLEKVGVWMVENRLKMNQEKTEFIAFGSSHTIEQLQVESIRVGNDPVEISSHVKYLGVWFDSTITMKKHISEKCRIASLKLYNIKKIHKYLTHDSLVRLVNALVLSHLDYCNALLIGLPDSTLRPLQNVQNSAARVILGLSKFKHISPGLKKLHWLPIKYRIEFKVLTMVFKSLHDEAPTYISDLLELKKSNYSLRSANGINLQEQRSKLKYYGDRAFSVCAPRLWNMLPNNVKTSPNLDIFKKNLKTYFLKIAFS